MKERPILFSSPMVRAILDGRKTQTRRVIRVQPCVINGVFTHHKRGPVWESGKPDVCPHGQFGDLLYVKEATWIWCRKAADGKTKTGRDKFRYYPHGREVRYYADCAGKPERQPYAEPNMVWKYKTARFMPRWSSRIQLEITEVRAERVAAISETDAMDEGVGISGADYPQWDGDPDQYRKLFRERWNIINETRGWSWAANPWVWAITFKRIKP